MSLRVLIVDDDEAIRRLIALLLGRDDRFTVIGQAEDGEQALELVGEHDPDLVLLDLAMPRMDGLQVLATLDGRARPRVAVLTGFNEERLQQQVLAAGAVLCLEKGRDFEDLANALATAGSTD